MIFIYHLPLHCAELYLSLRWNNATGHTFLLASLQPRYGIPQGQVLHTILLGKIGVFTTKLANIVKSVFLVFFE